MKFLKKHQFLIHYTILWWVNTFLQAVGFVKFYLGSNLSNRTSSTLVSCTNTNFQSKKHPNGLIKYFEPATMQKNKRPWP